MTRNLGVTSLIVLAAVLPAVPTIRAGAVDTTVANAPVLRVVVRSGFLTYDLAQPFRRTFPVNEQAEEGTVSSTVETAGWGFVEVMPCENRIALQVNVRGAARANSVRSRGRVHAITREFSHFWIVQELFVDAEALCLGGLGVSFPIHSQLVQIFSDLPEPVNDFIQGFGEARFDFGRKRDDRKITAAAEQRLYQEVSKEASKQLQERNKEYQEKVLDELWKAGFRRQDLSFSSDSEAVRMNLRHQDLSPGTAPALPGQPISMQLHATLVSQLSSRLAGKTYQDKELEDAFNDLNRFLKLPALPKVEDTPWSVTMAKRDPLSLKLDDNTIELTIRGDRYTSGDNTYTGMNVTARYRIVRKDDQLRLVRDAELEVLPPDFKPGTTLGARQQVLRTLLRRRFGRLLTQEITLRDLTPPEKVSLPGTFRVEHLQTRDGWLILGVGYNRGGSK